MSKINISYSQINTFKSCPRKYQLIYKNLYKKNNFNDSLQDGIDLHNMLDLHMKDQVISFINKEHLTESFNKIIKSDFIHDIYCNKDLYSKFYSEYEFSVPYKNINLIGKIDLLIVKDSILEIIDYKTGAENENFDQLILYAKALSSIEEFNHIKEFKLILYFTQTEKNHLIVKTRDEINDLVNDKFLPLENLLSNDYKIFFKKTSKLCDSCLFVKECFKMEKINKLLPVLDNANIMFDSSYNKYSLFKGNLEGDIAILDMGYDDLNNDPVFHSHYWKSLLEKNNISTNRILYSNANYYLPEEENHNNSIDLDDLIDSYLNEGLEAKQENHELKNSKENLFKESAENTINILFDLLKITNVKNIIIKNPMLLDIMFYLKTFKANNKIIIDDYNIYMIGEKIVKYDILKDLNNE